MCARFYYIRSICSFILLLLKIYFCDCRVLCQDQHATGWMSVGYSCPLRCSNILAAIEKLKVLDYSQVMHREAMNSKIRIESLNGNGNEKLSTSEEMERKKRHNIESIYGRAWKKRKNVLSDGALEKIKHHLVMRIRKYNGNDTDSNSTCDAILQNKNIKKSMQKKLMMKCTRRQLQFDADLVAVMTNIINQYTRPDYKFNEEMVVMLLNRTLTNKWPSQYAVRDIHSILRELTSEIQLLKEESKTVVKLTSKHCLNIYLPGCYCKTGYVEYHSMCVTPDKCVYEEWQRKYLIRIEFY